MSCVSANSFAQKEIGQTTTTPVPVRRLTQSTTSTFTPIERKFVETPKQVFINNLEVQSSVPNTQMNFGQESRFQQIKPINTFMGQNNEIVNPSPRFTFQFDETNRQPQSNQESGMLRRMPNEQFSNELTPRPQFSAPAAPKSMSTTLKYRFNRAQY